MGIIYKHTCLITGKYYIGQTTKTIEQRWKGHVNNSKKDKPYGIFQRAIKKYGEENWEHEVLESDISEEILNEREIFHIAKWNSSDTRYGYNLTEGGEGVIPNEETRKKLSESHKGKTPWNKGKHDIYTLDTIEKISNTLKGYKQTPEARKNMSEAHKGKKLSEEHKQKLSESCKISNSRPEVKQKMSENNLGNKNPNFGKHWTEERKQKLRETRRLKKNKQEQKLSNI